VPDPEPETLNPVVELDSDGDGTFELTGSPGQRFPVRYEKEGTFVATAKINGVRVGSLRIVVIGVVFPKKVACEVGFTRSVDVNTGGRPGTDVFFGPLDPADLTVSIQQVSGNWARLLVMPLRRGTPVILARLGARDGPVLGQREVDEFTQRTTSAKVLLTTDDEGGGSVGTARLVMDPLVLYSDGTDRNPFAVLTFSSAGCVFDGGITELVVTTADFVAHTDGTGSYAFRIHLAPGQQKHCHRTVFCQANSDPQEISFGDVQQNGVWVKFRSSRMVWCEEDNQNSNRALGDLEVTTSEDYDDSFGGFTLCCAPSYVDASIDFGEFANEGYRDLGSEAPGGSLSDKGTASPSGYVSMIGYTEGTHDFMINSGGGYGKGESQMLEEAVEVLTFGTLNVSGGGQVVSTSQGQAAEVLHVPDAGAAGTSITISLTDYTNKDPDERRRWKITDSDGKAPEGWQATTEGLFSEDGYEFSRTWVPPVGQESPNRQFSVWAWYDYNDNGSCDGEPYRLVQVEIVTIYKVTLTPKEIAANGVATSQATAATGPPGRSVTWSIEGDAKGCGITEDGEVTAATTGGYITVRATDAEFLSLYAEATLTIVKVESVWVDPPGIPADYTSTAQAAATTTPYPRDLVWSIVGDPLGCSIDGDGTVEAGVKAGTITVRATDKAVPEAHADGTLALIVMYLKQVSFGGTKYHVVRKDDGTGDYTPPHWQDNSTPPDGDADDPGDRKYPVCFTRNTKMKVSGKWYVEPPNPPVAISVWGLGPGNLEFPQTVASVTGNDVTITDVECAAPFANEVDFFDADTTSTPPRHTLDIAWTAFYGPAYWGDAGTSKNQAYIVLGDPLTTVYHTLAHLGCKNADGKTAPADVTAAIWTEFTDREVRRVDGVQLTYYASYTNGNVTTASLLSAGDGECGAWAKLFIDMRKVQHIDDVNEYVYVEASTDDGFIVENWTFSGTGTSGHSTYPYLNLPGTPLPGTVSYNWRFAEVTDAPGIAGQGTTNPASLFGNHQVVISGDYYDPSYGAKYPSLQAIDNTLAGFYREMTWPVDEPKVNLDLNGDGDKTDLSVPTKVMLFRKNPAGLDVLETRVNY
jgi:hypothetical protein